MSSLYQRIPLASSPADFRRSLCSSRSIFSSYLTSSYHLFFCYVFTRTVNRYIRMVFIFFVLAELIIIMIFILWGLIFFFSISYESLYIIRSEAPSPLTDKDKEKIHFCRSGGNNMPVIVGQLTSNLILRCNTQLLCYISFTVLSSYHNSQLQFPLSVIYTYSVMV